MSQFMKAFTDTQFTLIGFVIFFVMFLVLVASTYLKSEVRKHKYMESLPLEEERTLS